MGDLPHLFDAETSLAQTKLDCVDGEIVGVLLAAESDGAFTITNTRNGVQRLTPTNSCWNECKDKAACARAATCATVRV